MEDLGLTGTAIEVDIESYRLVVDGLVERPLSLTYDELLSYPSEYPYRKTLTLEEALRDDTYLAHTVYGETLPVEHGYPLRLVAGSKLGSYWVKWLFHIQVK
jgi:DMSO/TMAO reductase YedYZ molybdopterin-dependent catalytic subunit